jgi:hypothetical protein
VFCVHAGSVNKFGTLKCSEPCPAQCIALYPVRSSENAAIFHVCIRYCSQHSKRLNTGSRWNIAVRYTAISHLLKRSRFFVSLSYAVKSFKFLVRYQVLTATSIKMAVFWEAAPCSLLLTDVSDVHTTFFIVLIALQIWNIDHYLTDYTAQHSSRLLQTSLSVTLGKVKSLKLHDQLIPLLFPDGNSFHLKKF